MKFFLWFTVVIYSTFKIDQIIGGYFALFIFSLFISGFIFFKFIFKIKDIIPLLKWVIGSSKENPPNFFKYDPSFIEFFNPALVESRLKEEKKYNELELEKKWKSIREKLKKTSTIDLNKESLPICVEVIREEKEKLNEIEDKFDGQYFFEDEEEDKDEDVIIENFLVNLGLKKRKELEKYFYEETHSPKDDLFLLPNDENYKIDDKLLLFADVNLKRLSIIIPKLITVNYGKFNSHDAENHTDSLWDNAIKEYKAYAAQYSQLPNKIKKIENAINKFHETYGPIVKSASSYKKNKTNQVAENLVRCVNYHFPYPNLHWDAGKIEEGNFNVKCDSISKILMIEVDFPIVHELDIKIGKLKNDDPKYASAAQKDKLIKRSIYSLSIRHAYLAALYNYTNLYDAVAVNIKYLWIDKATGHSKWDTVSSLFATNADLMNLNLNKLDPEECFKRLKGISIPSTTNCSPIRPIFEMNRKDNRIVETKDVDKNLAESQNLAAIDWEDFESLVAQLFEWEFMKQGVEVKVTQASRDKGIDAIMFDPDPLKGGKYVLQAKRYTNVVDVSAVRDLYGTMMNEGANKGIIITTSRYGKDAYDFAKNKPLSLVDGDHLLEMFRKHGRKYHIDLAEAKKINKINDLNKKNTT